MGRSDDCVLPIKDKLRVLMHERRTMLPNVTKVSLVKDIYANQNSSWMCDSEHGDYGGGHDFSRFLSRGVFSPRSVKHDSQDKVWCFHSWSSGVLLLERHAVEAESQSLSYVDWASCRLRCARTVCKPYHFHGSERVKSLEWILVSTTKGLTTYKSRKPANWWIMRCCRVLSFGSGVGWPWWEDAHVLGGWKARWSTKIRML